MQAFDQNNLAEKCPFSKQLLGIMYYSLLFLFSQDFNGSFVQGGDDKYLSVNKLPLSDDNIN